MQVLLNLLSGQLSPTARVLTAMAPALLLFAYFIVGMILYLIRYAMKGSYRDPEIESRGSSILAGMWMRLYFAWLMQPLWRLVLRSGVPPTAVTTLSVLLAMGSGVSLAAGRFALGGWLYIFAGICDLLDGRLARARNCTTRAGGALDSILDRYSDAAVLFGLAWYYRDSWMLATVLAALVGSGLVPYIRARGEACGVSVKVGVMQRAERIVYLGVFCGLSPIVEVMLDPLAERPLHRVAVVGIVLLAVATQLTAFQRLLFVLSALGGDQKRAWWQDTNERPVARVVVAACVAGLVDFSLVNVLVLEAQMSAPLATGIGCLLGGVGNFSINRVWSFGSKDAKLPQIGRYSFVSLTSALLNMGGVAVLLLLPAMDFRVAWLVVRIAVFLAWNFPLHRDYVFSESRV